MLSGGQRKRVGLAQVLIRDPKILLMDEPFGPLDAQTRQIMGNLLLDLWSADRKAVLFVTHDLEEAIALSDRVVIMSAGPAARIIGDWRVPLTRPRDISEVKLDPAFHELHRDIWQKLKAEVMKGYARSEARLMQVGISLALALLHRYRLPKTSRGGMQCLEYVKSLAVCGGILAAGRHRSCGRSRFTITSSSFKDGTMLAKKNAGDNKSQSELRRRKRLAAAWRGPMCRPAPRATRWS